MYLTRTKSGYRFQIAIPTDLQQQIGKSPLRLSLGLIEAASARQLSRLLSGYAEMLFLSVRRTERPDTQMTRELLNYTLRNVVSEIELENEKARNLATHAAAHSAGMNEFEDYVKLRNEDIASGDTRGYADYMAEYRTSASIIERLSKIKDEIENGLRFSEISPQPAPLPMPNTDLGDLAKAIASLTKQISHEEENGDAKPLLSEALEQWIELREGLKIRSKKVKTDYNRILDFVTFAGDKPLNKYVFSDFQKWSNLLVRVPNNIMKIPEIRDFSREQAAEYNESLPNSKKFPTLTRTTIDTNYLSPLRIFFQYAAAEYHFRSPIENTAIQISSEASESVERSPFNVTELNKWFAHTADEARPDSKWLPLLATITGARIGELVYLQGKDVQLMQAEDSSEHYVIDLRSDLVLENGETEKRKTKTKTSRRLIALHSIFIEVGFIKYAKSRAADDWLFPHVFMHGKRRVKDPAGAASKRMGRILRHVGIHKPLEKVFHSTRHTAKDLMRMARVDQRTHDLQTGHAQKTVSDRYGSKVLLHQEVDVLACLPLPNGLYGNSLTSTLLSSQDGVNLNL